MNTCEPLIYRLAQLLVDKKLKIATAESCTGGLIGGLFTELAGSSAWFERGFITYSNLAKEEMLAVEPQLINDYGAVSEEVAQAMALGAVQHSAAQLALSVTGIAGPDGGSPEKPVGTVCFGWAMPGEKVSSLTCHFSNVSRQEVRRLSCIQAIERVVSLLEQRK